MAELLKGNAVTAAMKETMLAKIAQLKEAGVSPQMAIVRCGARPDDLSYEAGALKRFSGLGIGIKVIELPLGITQDDFIAELEALNRDPSVHGVLAFRPLPRQLDESVIKYVLSAEKDMDAMNPLNMAKVFAADPTGYPPCTPEAVMELLEHYGVDLCGKRVTIIGRSMVVGKPLAMMMLAKNATVTICHTRTKEMQARAREADILVACAGKAKMVTADFVSAGQIVIDVGINMDENNKLCGDVDFAAVEPIVSAITPVPGGVGTVTTSCLANHVVRAALKQASL
ncbi:bifunctional 5,10-methylenetetrahydrofolate dehydrogenase/5,10-methenyltetrahydrofolate cyclohydrolase [Acidaminobacterium chupaoyuni]